MFNLKPSLDKRIPIVQVERVECKHPKAHNHLNSLMVLVNLLELMRVTSNKMEASKFIKELLNPHQHKM